MTRGVISSAMVARSRVVAEPRWSPDGRCLAWVEAFDGRADVLVAPADGSGAPVVVTADHPVSPVGGYGGGAFSWAGSDQLLVSAADGRLLLLPASGGAAATLSDHARAGSPAADPTGRRVAFVLEDDHSCAVVVAGLDARNGPIRLSTADYGWDPVWAPDWSRVAWHEWDLPNMPWDGGRICTAAPDGTDRRVVAGGDTEGVGQPRWSPDGRRLAFISDRDGWTNVWVGGPDGRDARPVLPEAREQAEPPWGPGQRSYAWSPDGEALAMCTNEDGFGRLVTVRGGRVTSRVDGWHHGVDWGRTGIVAVHSSACEPSTLTVLADGRRHAVARGPSGGFEALGLVQPEPVRWDAEDGTPVHGLLWRPDRRDRRRPPLLVDVHGGPTGQATATWQPWPQFLVSRGWAVLAPNGRGSTGYGREFAQALAGGWGSLDVDDVAAGIRHARSAGWCDPGRVVVSGRSAGALTALLVAVRHPDLLTAAISQYGVTDLLALAATTHRFESRYLDRLVGVLPADEARYRERSPLTHAARISVPVLVLQGDADKVVPPAQADALVAAVRAGGGVAESRRYEGEGHGWSRADTIEDVYERVASFLRRHVPEG